jgi:hypothetical protein
MAEFSVRIDFYRSPDKPPQDAGYVGSALRDEFHMVVRAQWPGDGSLTDKPPGAGEQMLRDYDAQGGWRLHFFSDHAPVEPFPGQP